MRLSFKEWLSKEGFVPGTYLTGPKDITNTGMGVRSKYVGPDETGEKEQGSHIDVADFGFDKKLRRMKQLNKFRRSNV